ncbi:MAG TPA: aromatic amino acid lyase [Solirubrobacteraceae bacterium]
MPAAVPITGGDLVPTTLAAVARDFAAVRIDPAAQARIEAAAAVVEQAARDGTPVYGVTTGLGPRVVEPVDGAEATMFSLRTLRGRATAVGEPLDRDLVRAAMAVRLNGLCAGGAGAGLGVAEGLAGLLNARVHPRVPRSGSVGASDLCLLAHVGLTLIGEGEAELDGEWLPSAAALQRAGLRPVALGPKDGLAICSSSAVSLGAAALALVDAEALLQVAQVATALSMEGFRANLSPLDPRVVAARPAPGQEWAAAGLRALLAGGGLADGSGPARRLQDPLSFRCASQIHGSLWMALDLLGQALAPDLSGAADNPLVLAQDGQIVSTGNFHVPALALAMDATAVGIAQVAAAAGERQARLKNERLSGLPSGLSSAGTTGSGLAPLSKTAQALTMEIGHLAAPLALFETVGAGGVEDDSTGAVQAALRLRSQLQKLTLVLAIELLVAAQAVDLAAPERLGRGASAAYQCVRELVEPLGEDRAIGPDVERLASRAVDSGALLAAVRAAVE